MRLAVLDTNVIVSAGIRGDAAPGRLVMEWVLEGQVQAVTCPAILREYRSVVRRARFLRHGFPLLWLEFLIAESLHLPNPDPWPDALPDPDDAIFLALAHLSGAWLVTGNLRHFPQPARRGVTVLAPADYLAHLTGSASR